MSVVGCGLRVRGGEGGGGGGPELSCRLVARCRSSARLSGGDTFSRLLFCCAQELVKISI